MAVSTRKLSILLFLIFLLFVVVAIFSVFIDLAYGLELNTSLENKCNYCELMNYTVLDCFYLWDFSEFPVVEYVYVNQSYYYNSTFLVNNTVFINTTDNNCSNSTINITNIEYVNQTVYVRNVTQEDLDHEYRMTALSKGVVVDDYCREKINCSPCLPYIPVNFLSRETCDLEISEKLQTYVKPESNNIPYDLILIAVIVVICAVLVVAKLGLFKKQPPYNPYVEGKVSASHLPGVDSIGKESPTDF